MMSLRLAILSECSPFQRSSNQPQLSMLRFILVLVIAAECAGVCSTASEPSKPSAPLLPELSEYVDTLPAELDQIPADRALILEDFAAQIATSIRRDGSARLNFICTHNSRRSHLSQVWAQTAALHFGIDKLQTYSGGTEATACNVRTIDALRRAGFAVEKLTDGRNPHYRIRFSHQAEPLEAFSKIYSDAQAGNPEKDFIAAMCCSRADRECPVVNGATARIPLHYEDPKVADNTPAESDQYDERCRQIAVEMFFVMKRVAEKARS